MVTVYVWFDRGKYWGHSSMKVDGGQPHGIDYISWWPMDNDKGGAVLGTGAIANRTYESDLRDEGTKPDHAVPLSGLDEMAIKKWWREWRLSDHKYRALDRNCSTTVAKALKAGGCERFCSRRDLAQKSVWTPSDLWEFVRAISAGIQTPR